MKNLKICLSWGLIEKFFEQIEIYDLRFSVFSILKNKNYIPYF